MKREEIRRRKATLGAAGVGVAAVGIIVGLSIRTHDTPSAMRVAVTSDVHSSSGDVSTTTVTSQSQLPVSQVLTEYGATNSYVPTVSKVALKEVTWAQLEPGLEKLVGGSVSPPTNSGVPVFSASSNVYVVVQGGAVNANVINGGPPGDTYSWQ